MKQKEFYELTPKEREILKWVVLGLSNKKIATQMNLSVSTINTHVSNIRLKTFCDTKIALVNWYFQNKGEENEMV